MDENDAYPVWESFHSDGKIEMYSHHIQIGATICDRRANSIRMLYTAAHATTIAIRPY